MEPEEKPKGTLAILLIYLVILVLNWIGMYLLMLHRAGG